VRFAVVAIAVIALTQIAHAGSWSFSWTCAGSCAPGQLDVRGNEIGFPDERSCESARSQKVQDINSPGSAGSTTECVDSDPGTPGSRGSIGSAARAARLVRAFFSVDGGRGYEATYEGGRTARGAHQLGTQIELMFGRDEIGLGIELGMRRDAGTPPVAGASADPMLLVDLGFGLGSSPFALYTGPRVEVRPDFGAFYVWANRIGCNRCTVNLLDPQPVEPNQGNTFRLRGGLVLYWGASKENGVALDALVQFGTLGDIEMGADEPTSVELRPPRLLFRLSYVRRPRD